jgi:hypothetical protein
MGTTGGHQFHTGQRRPLRTGQPGSATGEPTEPTENRPKGTGAMITYSQLIHEALSRARTPASRDTDTRPDRSALRITLRARRARDAGRLDRY